MFNNSRFDYLKFGLRAEDTRDFAVQVTFNDTLKNLSGSGSAIFVDLSVFESMRNVTKVTPTLPEKMVALEALKANVDVIGGLIVSFTPLDELKNSLSLVKDISVSKEFKDNKLCKVYVGKDFAIYGEDSNFSCGANLNVFVAKDIIIKDIITELLNCHVSTVILDTDECTIKVTIPANSTLEIHSDTYDVFLDGENIIHLHNGDWVFLDRSVVSIQIDTGTGGGLEGQMLYDERYL